MALHAGSQGGAIATTVAAAAFPLLAPDGSNTAPSYAFANAATTGYARLSDGIYSVTAGTYQIRQSTSGGVQVPSTGVFEFSSSGAGSSSDVILARDAAATLAVKNADTAQTVRIYGANTGAKYLSLTHNATNAVISTTTGSIHLTPQDDSTGAATVVHTATDTITGGVTDGYCASLRLAPTYNAGSSQTVTRHNYIDMKDTVVGGAGPAAVTASAAIRFDANIGTHRALAANSTNAAVFTANAGPVGSSTAIQGWLRINVNGTLRFIPMW